MRMLDDHRKKVLLTCLLSGFIFFILCHGFMLMNPAYSHDSLHELIRRDDTFQLQLGRFGQEIWYNIFGRVTASWFIGMIAALFFAFSSFLIADLLSIQKTSTIILMTGVLTTNYTLCNSLATYMPWVDIYGGTIFLSVLAVYLSSGYKYGFIAGIPLVVFSLSLYQPYTLCIPALGLCVIIHQMAEKGKKWIITLVKLSVMIVIGYLVYRVVLQMLLNSKGIELSDTYNSLSKVGLSESFFSQFREELGNTYSTFFGCMFMTFKFLPYSSIWIVLFYISFMTELILFQIRYVRHSTLRIICFYVAVLFIPLIYNVQFLITKTAYHVLVRYSIYMAWTIPVLLHEKNWASDPIPAAPVHTGSVSGRMEKSKKYLKYITPVLLVVFLFSNFKYANNVYTAKYLRERATLSLLTRIMSRAEATEGYVPDEMPIVVTGNLDRNPVIGGQDPAFYGTEVGDSIKFISISYDIDSYLRYYMGYDNIQNEDAIRGNEEAEGMPAYPEEGFAKVIDGKLVIRLSP